MTKPHIRNVRRRLSQTIFTPPETQSLPPYYTLIDLLRSLAAIAVVLWHYQHFFVPMGEQLVPPSFHLESAEPFYAYLKPFYRSGFLAVQLFWTISGFIFSAVYYRNSISSKSFAIHRMARLYPLHIITLLIVAIMQLIIKLNYGEYFIYQENGIFYFFMQIFFASNWIPTSPLSFNGPIWSVSLEILIYGVFWIILPRLFKFGILIPFLITVIFAVFFGISNYRLLDCGQNFFFGSTIFVLNAHFPIRVKLGIGLILGALALAVMPMELLPRACGISLLCGGLVLVVAAIEPYPITRLAAPFRWLGDSTYGIYLWHFPVQLAIVLIVGPVSPSFSLAREPAFLLLSLAATLVIAYASFVWIEQPARKWVKSWWVE